MGKKTRKRRNKKSSEVQSSVSLTGTRRSKRLAVAKLDSGRSTLKRKQRSFDERCDDLIWFKEEFGHCNVLKRYHRDPSLGGWCNDIRKAYKRIQEGQTTRRNLSSERIARLEEIGFKWKIKDRDAVFERHCCDLEAFRDNHGHCRVPKKYADNASLGTWCGHMRNAYNRIQGGQSIDLDLSPERIVRLNHIGFAWKMQDHDAVFERHCCELEAFRDINGHCRVPRNFSDNPSLGMWCGHMRNAYNRIQEGQPSHLNLSPERIERLEKIGFTWKIRDDSDAVFETNCCDLEAFIDINGHCHVPKKYADNPSLGGWCSELILAYNGIQEGRLSRLDLSPERIARLEEIGFTWKIRDDSDAVIETNCCDLEAFRDIHGHCHVPVDYPDNPSLGVWCKDIQSDFTKHALSPEQIERLKEIGLIFKVSGRP
jgi:hypothetical protein